MPETIAMDLIHKFLNIVAPPFTFFSLCLFLPPFMFFKAFTSLLNSIFSEDVNGKVVIITGASSGIGEHLAYEYASRGACLALCARREHRLDVVADRARDLGSPDVITIPADVAKVDDCRHLVEETFNHFGRLDHLVNNAGLTSAAMFEDIKDITRFRQIMDVNFWGSVYTTRYAVPLLKNSKGKIIVISSSAAWLPAPRHTMYNASKAAMLSFFETLRVELGSDIKITIATPGYIESELTQGKFMTSEGKVDVDQDLRDAQVGTLPVGSVSGCAKAIVNSACRGERYLTQPSWFRVTYWTKVMCPEMLEWGYRIFFLSSRGESHIEAPSKKMLDLTGAKKVLWPSSIQQPPAPDTAHHQVKTE